MRFVIVGSILLVFLAGTFAVRSAAEHRTPRTYHVGFGRTELASAEGGDRILCPGNGAGATVPTQNGVAVDGRVDRARGSTAGVAHSISLSQSLGEVVVICR